MASEAEVPMTLDEALADVAARFLLNLPSNELPSVDRLFMQLQQAHWFYEDFYVDKYEHIEHLSGREFSRIMFHTCPLLERYKSQHADFYEQFKQYISSIPVYGTIMFTKGMKDMVLCKSFGGKSWNAARGKLNAGETPMECAARETLEETGYDPTKLIKADKYVEWTSGAQKVRLYVCIGAPKKFQYAPQTRKEIAEIRVWPTTTVLRKVKGKAGHQRFWHLFPAMGWLRAFVRSGGNIAAQTARTPQAGKARGRGRGGGGGGGGGDKRPSKQTADLHNAETFDDLGDDDGWDVDGMFSAASQLTGIQFTYDGNNEQFGEGLTLTYDTDVVAARAAKEAQGGANGSPASPPQELPPTPPHPDGAQLLASLRGASQASEAPAFPSSGLQSTQAPISSLQPGATHHHHQQQQQQQQHWPTAALGQGHGHAHPPHFGHAGPPAQVHAFHPHGLGSHAGHTMHLHGAGPQYGHGSGHQASHLRPAAQHGSSGMHQGGHRGTPPAIAAALAKSTPGAGGVPAGSSGMHQGGHRGTPPAIAAALAKSTPGAGGVPAGSSGMHQGGHRGTPPAIAAALAKSTPGAGGVPAGSSGMHQGGHRGTPPAIAAALAKSTPGAGGSVMHMSGGSLLSKLRMAQ